MSTLWLTCGIMEPENNDDNGNMPAGTPLQEYQTFIDGLLEWPRYSVIARWTREWGSRPPDSVYVTPPDFDAKMRQFTHEQRQVMAEMIQQEHEGAIGSVLAYLTDKIYSEGLRIYKNGVPLAIEPYDTEMYYDWVCRCHGSSWPEPETE